MIGGKEGNRLYTFVRPLKSFKLSKYPNHRFPLSCHSSLVAVAGHDDGATVVFPAVSTMKGSLNVAFVRSVAININGEVLPCTLPIVVFEVQHDIKALGPEQLPDKVGLVYCFCPCRLS